MRPLVVVGAGGFGREVVQIVAAVNAVAPTWELVGFLDDGPAAGIQAGTVPLLGPVAALSDLPGHAAVLAVGSPPGRAAIARAHPRQEWATLVHPDTTIAPGTRLGDGWFSSGTPPFEESIRLRGELQRLRAETDRAGDPFKLVFRMDGADPATPVAVVENGGTPQQRVTRAPLSGVAERAREVGVRAPAVVVVGHVAAPDLLQPPSLDTAPSQRPARAR